MEPNTILNTLRTHVSPGALTAVKVIEVAVYCVEQLASQMVRGMSSQAKLDAAVAMLPSIIEQACAAGLCDATQAEALTAKLTAWGTDITHVIEAIVSVAHNPQLVQAEEKVKQWCGVHCHKK